MNRLIIIGAGGHGKVCAEIAMNMNSWDEICFLDDSYPNKKKCLNFNIVGTIKEILSFKESDFFVAIGNNEVRGELINYLLNEEISVATLIHPAAYISKYSSIGVGTSIHQFAVINTDTKIGVGCIINTSSVIEHENLINNFVHISPNVSLGGQVQVGSLSWIGIGTTIINNIDVGSGVIIGANSTVIKNILKKGKYVGTPVKINEVL